MKSVSNRGEKIRGAEGGAEMGKMVNSSKSRMGHPEANFAKYGRGMAPNRSLPSRGAAGSNSEV